MSEPVIGKDGDFEVISYVIPMGGNPIGLAKTKDGRYLFFGKDGTWSRHVAKDTMDFPSHEAAKEYYEASRTKTNTGREAVAADAGGGSFTYFCPVCSLIHVTDRGKTPVRSCPSSPHMDFVVAFPRAEK